MSLIKKNGASFSSSLIHESHFRHSTFSTQNNDSFLNGPRFFQFFRYHKLNLQKQMFLYGNWQYFLSTAVPRTPSIICVELVYFSRRKDNLETVRISYIRISANKKAVDGVDFCYKTNNNRLTSI